MFGPNTQIYKADITYEFSHRDIEFQELYRKLENRFQIMFNLRDYHILFLAGSGSLALEAVFYSINNKLTIFGTNGKFTNRLIELRNRYKKSSNGLLTTAGCVLETSTSTYHSDPFDIADAISSFPYYPIHKDTKIFITCANKQLGSFPGLSIVGVHKDFGTNLLEPATTSYLSIANYLENNRQHQLPFTAPIANFIHLYETLGQFDIFKLKNKIDNVSSFITSFFKDAMQGDTPSPVLSIAKYAIPARWAQRYQIYNVNNPDAENYQIFTYSAPTRRYLDFLSDISR